jgi:hypothetical protein
MSFKEGLKKLRESREFKDFKAKNKKSFLFSAFFILNPNLDLETQQFDYFLSQKKVATFLINEKIEHKIDEFNPQSKITALDENIKVDVEDLRHTINNELRKKWPQGAEVNKIIAILQKIDNKQIWNITCLLGNMKLLKIHINCFDGKVLESEEASIFDMIKIKKTKE